MDNASAEIRHLQAQQICEKQDEQRWRFSQNPAQESISEMGMFRQRKVQRRRRKEED